MERNLGVARIMLEPAELALMLIEAAVSTSLTAAATVAANVDEDKRGDMFDATLKLIAQSAQRDREPSLKKVAVACAKSGGGDPMLAPYLAEAVVAPLADLMRSPAATRA